MTRIDIGCLPCGWGEGLGVKSKVFWSAANCQSDTTQLSFSQQNALLLRLTKVTCSSTCTGPKLLDAGPGMGWPACLRGRRDRRGRWDGWKQEKYSTFISPCCGLLSFLQACWSAGMHSSQVLFWQQLFKWQNCLYFKFTFNVSSTSEQYMTF